MSASVATAKLHLRVTGTAEDTIITAYLAAATAWIERFIGKKLTAGAVVEQFTAFGDYIAPTWGPVNSITSIAYTNANGDAAAVSDSRLQDGKIYPPIAGWPSFEIYSAITVTYNAGFATTPTELEQAQLLLTNHFYENRGLGMPLENSDEGKALDSLCRPFRKPTLR